MLDGGVKRTVLELCVDDPSGLMAAISGGADRVELTNTLSLGGLTPSAGFMRMACDTGLPTIAMIRPRAGSFVFSEDEIALMIMDIAEVRAHGLSGVVLGVARPDDTLDVEVLKRLIDAAGPLETSLHRVFDLTPDPFEAIDQAVELGFTRILTTGQKSNVIEGLETLIALQSYAGARISIMPGGGVTLQNVGQIIRSTGSTEIHASCSRYGAPNPDRLVRFGFAPKGVCRRVDPETVAEMRRMLAVIAAPDPEMEGVIEKASADANEIGRIEK